MGDDTEAHFGGSRGRNRRQLHSLHFREKSPLTCNGVAACVSRVKGWWFFSPDSRGQELIVEDNTIEENAVVKTRMGLAREE